jgi:hypothetical protein
MPLREEESRLVDDTRSFSSQELTAVWEWLDSFDLQPLRPREHARLDRYSLTFTQRTHVFRGRLYSVAQCSDGRELLGSVIGVVPMAPVATKLNIMARLRGA